MQKQLTIIRKFFAVKNTLNSRQGLSYLEVIIVLSIIIILILWVELIWPINHRELLVAQLKLLQQALYLARSEAILKSKKVYLCLSDQRQQCSFNISNPSIMIFMFNLKRQQEVLYYFRYPLGKHMFYQYNSSFFGNTKVAKITFLPNGMTINNGHFCVDQQHNYCLYLNQAGKAYLRIFGKYV